MRAAIPIELTRDETQRADAIALAIVTELRKGGAKHRNNLETTFERALEMMILGKRGEAAFSKFAKIHDPNSRWLPYSRSYEIVFQGHKWDAKAIPRNDCALCIYPAGLHRTWRYALVGCAFANEGRYTIIAWARGDDIAAHRNQRRKVDGRSAYFLAQNDPLLRDCNELTKLGQHC